MTTNAANDTLSAYALVNGPIAAGQVLAQLQNVPPGYYRFDVTYSTTGTSAAADSDNVALNVPGATAHVVPSTQGTPAVSATVNTWWATVTALGTVTLTAIANGSGAAVVYHVTLRATLWPREGRPRS